MDSGAFGKTDLCVFVKRTKKTFATPDSQHDKTDWWKSFLISFSMGICIVNEIPIAFNYKIGHMHTKQEQESAG